MFSLNWIIEYYLDELWFKRVKICLHETYTKVYVGKHLFDTYPIQNDLKQGDT
jgi:hypothetical protein